MPIVLKSGSLDVLEPSQPVQACNGIALPCHDTAITPLPPHCPHQCQIKESPGICGPLKVDTHTHTHTHTRARAHTHAHALFCFRLSLTQIVLHSITGTDLVSECFHVIQIQFPSHLASVDVDFPFFHG
jgi:hypothetical protein